MGRLRPERGWAARPFGVDGVSFLLHGGLAKLGKTWNSYILLGFEAAHAEYGRHFFAILDVSVAEAFSFSYVLKRVRGVCERVAMCAALLYFFCPSPGNPLGLRCFSGLILHSFLECVGSVRRRLRCDLFIVGALRN